MPKPRLPDRKAEPQKKMDRKEMPCFDYAQGMCVNSDRDCAYSHDPKIIRAYQDSKHLGLTSAKKDIARSNKDRFKVNRKGPVVVMKNTKVRPGPQ